VSSRMATTRATVRNADTLSPSRAVGVTLAAGPVAGTGR
jgi:hypothetical protein